jgi:hypothetical protein
LELNLTCKIHRSPALYCLSNHQKDEVYFLLGYYATSLGTWYLMIQDHCIVSKCQEQVDHWCMLCHRTGNLVTLWCKLKNWHRKGVVSGYKQVRQYTQDTTPMVHLLLLFRNTFRYRLNTVITIFLILGEMIPLDCQLFLWLFFVSCSYTHGMVPCFMYFSNKMWDVHI